MQDNILPDESAYAQQRHGGQHAEPRCIECQAGLLGIVAIVAEVQVAQRGGSGQRLWNAGHIIMAQVQYLQPV